MAIGTKFKNLMSFLGMSFDLIPSNWNKIQKYVVIFGHEL